MSTQQNPHAVTTATPENGDEKEVVRPKSFLKGIMEKVLEADSDSSKEDSEISNFGQKRPLEVNNLVYFDKNDEGGRFLTNFFGSYGPFVILKKEGLVLTLGYPQGRTPLLISHDGGPKKPLKVTVSEVTED